MQVILTTKNNNENNDNGRDNHCAIDNDINFSIFTKLNIDTAVEKNAYRILWFTFFQQ